MDIDLGGKPDGIDAAREIRRIFDVPVVFLTGFGDERTLMRAKDAEPLGYLVKPFEASELRATLEVALYQHEVVRRRLVDGAREMHEEYRSAVQSALKGVFRSDPRGRLLDASPALVSLLGFASRDELLRALHDVQAMLQLNPCVAAAAGPEGTHGFELQAYRKDGSTIWVSGNIRALHDSAGRLICYEGSLQRTTPANDSHGYSVSAGG